jgi:predicted nucleotidyltransferase component of viral defense system
MNEIILERFQSYNTTTKEQALDAMREIIQEVALMGLWRSKFFDHAAFYGGTALRILYGIDRFSEDLDFTLLEKSPSFHISSYCESVYHELISYGFDVKVEEKKKTKKKQE